MTRLLILGNSHVGALKAADIQFREAFPSIETGYFSSPGATFLKGRVDREGVFSPALRGQKDRDFVTKINGAESCNLRDWDHVLVTGHRPRFSSAAGMFGSFDLLEGSRTGKHHLVSFELFRAVASDQIARFMAEFVRAFPDCPNVTVTVAPFPAASIVERAPGYDLGRTIAGYLPNPDMQTLFDWWLDEVERTVRSAGYGFMRQPPETMAGPGVTISDYARPNADPAAKESWVIDHRHMNGDFGLAVLRYFAKETLGLTAATHEQNEISWETMT